MKIYKTNIDALTLRETQKSDSELIFSFIYKLAIYEKMEDQVIADKDLIAISIFDHHQAEVLLCYEHDTPIGIMLFHENYSTFMGQANMYIEDIYIDQPYRHKGYGTELFEVVKKIADERNYGRVDWVCLNWNQPSIDFYKKIGAKPLDDWILFRLNTKKNSNK